MNTGLRTSLLGLLALAGSLGVGCAPPEGGQAQQGPQTAPVDKVAAKQAQITSAQAVAAAQNGVTWVMNDNVPWIRANGCAPCHRGGAPLFGSSLAVKNGLTVLRKAQNAADFNSTSSLDYFGKYVADQGTRWGDVAPSNAYWLHDPTHQLRFVTGAFQFWGLSGYTAYSGNSQYLGQLKTAVKWVMSPRHTNGAIYDPASTNADVNNSAAAYRNTGWAPTRQGDGRWTYTFPNDGKRLAAQARYFIPLDWVGYPTVTGWQQSTGMTASAIALYLSLDQALPAAERATYQGMLDSLLDSLEASIDREKTTMKLQDLFFALLGLQTGGRTAQSGNAYAVAARTELLARKIAGVAGWQDPNAGAAGGNALSTGEALYGLCISGVRLDQNAQVNDAITWLASAQNADGSWSFGGLTKDTLTTYAALGLSCYGVLNIDVGLSNVTPPKAGDATTASISPGIASTQAVSVRVNVTNSGYVTNTFTFTASGGVAGTTFAFNPASITVNPNTTNFTTLTATFPANLPAGINAPLTIVTSYTAAGGSTSTTKTQAVNIGTVVDPGAGALATTSSFTAGNGATVIVGNTLTLSAKAVGSNNTQVNAGSMTFFVGGQAIGTVAPSGGVFTTSWVVPNNINGNASIAASFSGAVVGATSYAASSTNGAITVTLPPAPPAPTVSGPGNGYSSTNGNVSVTGASQAGATVTVKDSGGANLGVITVPAGGNFNVPLNLPPGVYTITVVATNAGGNSPPSTSQVVTINPAAPVVASPANNSTTANTTVSVSGTGYAGSTVTVKDGATTVGTFTVDAAGNWSGSVALSLGAHTLNVTQSIRGATSANTAVNVGVLPPAPAITSPANGANLPNGNNVIAGTCTVGTTVTIFDNGVTTNVTGPCAANGQYNITIALGFGSHVLTTTATNNAGASAQSAGRTVSVAPGAPVITAPAAASSDIIGPFTFAGTGVAGATVRIYDNGVEINSQVIAANGAFSFTVNAPALGGHNLTATQTANGLTSPASAARTITVHLDSDGDTVYDEIDNCINLWNKDQVDRDADGVGDVCDKAPGQTDASNNTTSATDASLTTDPSADTNLLAANQNNLLNLPAGAWATRSTLTLVNIPANNSGNIEIWGKASPSVAAWTKMTSYDAQLGPSHPVTLAGGLTADVAVTTPRTSLANYANRYKQFQVRVKEADGSVTTIPHCASGTTVSAVDDRCVNSAIAYTLVDGTNVDAGIKLIFKMKAL